MVEYKQRYDNLSYRFTVDNNPEDMKTVERLRANVKQYNKTARMYRSKGMKAGHDLYVKLQARGPRTAPALADGRGPRAYDDSLPVRHATHFDVYVYERRNF